MPASNLFPCLDCAHIRTHGSPWALPVPIHWAPVERSLWPLLGPPLGSCWPSLGPLLGRPLGPYWALP